MISSAIAPIFTFNGFGIPESAVAVIMCLRTKEVVVATFGTLYGVGEEALGDVLMDVFKPLSAYSFMVFILLYIPCLAAMLTVNHETTWRFALGAGGYSAVCGCVGCVLYRVLERYASWIRVILSGQRCLFWSQ